MLLLGASSSCSSSRVMIVWVFFILFSSILVGVGSSFSIFPPPAQSRAVPQRHYYSEGVPFSLKAEGQNNGQQQQEEEKGLEFETTTTTTTTTTTNNTAPVSWASSWFPLAFVESTDQKRPTKHYLLGAPIVVWLFGNEWYAMLDKCPHRLAPLSEGRIVPSTGDIECPYHGFTFDGTSGNCTRVPQQQQEQATPTTSSLPGIKTRGCATALPCRVQQGIIWVHSAPLYGTNTETTEAATAAAMPEEEDLRRYRIEALEQKGVLHVDYFRDLPMEWSTLAENVLDPAHLPFTHHKTISSRDKAKPIPLVVRTPWNNDRGFQADRNTDPPGSVEFRAPHLIVAETARNGSFTDWNVVHAIPTLPGRCRLLVRVVFEVAAMKPPMKWIFSLAFRQPAFLLHLSNHKILEDDNIFLHAQGHNYRMLVQQNKTFRDGTYLPTTADAVVIAFHRWLKKYESQHSHWSPHTPPGSFLDRDVVLTQSELLDRKHTHTQACSSCSSTKKWLERLDPVLGVGTFLCTIRAFGVGATNSIIRWRFGILACILYSIKIKLCGMRKNMDDGIWPPPRNK